MFFFMQVIWKLYASRFHVAVLSHAVAVRVLAMHFDLQPMCVHFDVAGVIVGLHTPQLQHPTLGTGVGSLRTCVLPSP